MYKSKKGRENKKQEHRPSAHVISNTHIKCTKK